MAAACASCRKLLPVRLWLTGRVHCDACEARLEARREASVRQYLAGVSTAFGDRVITPQEWAALHRLQAQLGLTPQDAARAHMQIFQGWYNVAVRDRVVTPQELSWLRHVQRELQLPESAVGDHLSKALRLLQLHQLQSGHLPVVPQPPIALQRGEVCHWVESGSQYIEEQSRRVRVSGSQGMSFRIAKGLTYRVGASQGYSYSVPYNAVVDLGALVVTNKRVAYVGARRSFSIPYGKLLGFQAFENAIQVQRDAITAKPQIFTAQDVDALCIVLTRTTATTTR